MAPSACLCRSPSGPVMSVSARHVARGVAVSLLIVGCAGERSDTAKAPAVEKPFTPAQYSVADFYDNKGFFGASYSPDRQKVLVGSNASGIWNAYAIPVAGGEPEALTASTTNSIFPITYFPG